MESLHQWSSVQRKSSVQHKSDCTSQFDSTCVFNLLLSRRASATSLPPALSKKLIYFLVFDRFSAGECALQGTTLSKMLFLPPAPRLRGLVQYRRLSSKASFLDPAGYAGLLRTNVHVRTLFPTVGRTSRTLRSTIF